MKKVRIFSVMKKLENFLNKQNVTIIDVKITAVEQSIKFQDGFVAIVFYDDLIDQEKELLVPCPQHNAIDAGCPLNAHVWLCGSKPCMIKQQGITYEKSH